MKRINQYKKLFQIEDQIELGALKTRYRNLVKQWHPDKFQDDDPLKIEAEQMGTPNRGRISFFGEHCPGNERSQSCVVPANHHGMWHRRFQAQRTFVGGYL